MQLQLYLHGFILPPITNLILSNCTYTASTAANDSWQMFSSHVDPLLPDSLCETLELYAMQSTKMHEKSKFETSNLMNCFSKLLYHQKLLLLESYFIIQLFKILSPRSARKNESLKDIICSLFHSKIVLY